MSEFGGGGVRRPRATAHRGVLLPLLSQAHRRKLCIQKQRENRSASLDKYRNGGRCGSIPADADRTAFEEMDDDNAGTDDVDEKLAAAVADAATKKIYNPRQQFPGGNHAQYGLCIPEHMLEIPSLYPSSRISSDLNGDEETESWLFKVRPTGISCLVSTTAPHMKGVAYSSASNGVVLSSFKSLLPRNCLLDCILNETTRVLYVMDILVWKGQTVVDTTAEFRMFWLENKLSECSQYIFTVSDQNDYAVSPVAYLDCNASNLMAAYANEGSTFSYEPDGFLFYHKFGYYQQGLTPLVLHWKDRNCSMYALQESAMMDENDNSSVVFRLTVSELSSHHVDQGAAIHGFDSGAEKFVELKTLEGFALVKWPQKTVARGHAGMVVLVEGDLVTCRCQQLGYQANDVANVQSCQNLSQVADYEGTAAHTPYISNVTIERVTPRARVRKSADSWTKIVAYNPSKLGMKLVSFDDIVNSVTF
jgi:hypothetical protein